MPNFVCTRTHTAVIDGENVTFTAGVSRVTGECPSVKDYPEWWEDARFAMVRSQARNSNSTESYSNGFTAGRTRDPWDADTAQGPGDLRERALAANERSQRMPDEAREHMARTIESDDDRENRLSRYVIETSRPAYFRAFSKWLNDPLNGHREWTDAELGAYQSVQTMSRAMTIGTGSQGGVLVPYELDPSILIASVGSANPMRKVARVVTTAYNVKKFVTSLGVTSSWDPEATEVSDDSPTLLQPSITCAKGMCFVPVSFELYEDSDIAQQIGALFADSKDQHEALSFTITQSNGPVGLITALVAAGGSTVVATGTNVLAQADLYANQAALPPRWRPRARWMMNLSILNGFRQLPQATGFNYSVISDDGPKPKALGWVVEENSSMDGTLTGAAADYAVLSGDFNQFAIVDRIGVSLEVVPHMFGASGRPTGQRGFLMHWRTGSDVLIPDAFRLSNYST